MPRNIWTATWLAVALMTVWTACQPGDSDSTRDVPADAPADAAGDAAQPGDASGDADVPTAPFGCDPTQVRTSNFEPFADAPKTQIHPATAFDGQGIWFAFNLPALDGSANFAPWAARVACNGDVLIAPFQVATGAGNAVDPAIAIQDDTVAIVWQEDIPENAPDNMDVWIRTFGIDGTPRTADAVLLTPTAQGNPVPGTLWLPSVAAVDDGFLIAATLADGELELFQTLLVRVDTYGNPALDTDAQTPLDAFWPAREAGTTQTYPAIAADAEGRMWTAWTRWPEGQEDAVDRVVFGALGDWGQSMTPAPFPDAQAESQGAHLAVTREGPPVVVLAATIGGEDLAVRLRQIVPQTTAQDLVLNTPSKIDHSPVVALDGSRGLVAWYRVRTGYQADVVFQRFDRVDGKLVPRGQEDIANLPEPGGHQHAAIGAYPLALTPVGSGRYLLSWVEQTPQTPTQEREFRIRSRFVAP